MCERDQRVAQNSGTGKEGCSQQNGHSAKKLYNVLKHDGRQKKYSEVERESEPERKRGRECAREG